MKKNSVHDEITRAIDGLPEKIQKDLAFVYLNLARVFCYNEYDSSFTQQADSGQVMSLDKIDKSETVPGSKVLLSFSTRLEETTRAFSSEAFGLENIYEEAMNSSGDGDEESTVLYAGLHGSAGVVARHYCPPFQDQDGDAVLSLSFHVDPDPARLRQHLSMMVASTEKTDIFSSLSDIKEKITTLEKFDQNILSQAIGLLLKNKNPEQRAQLLQKFNPESTAPPPRPRSKKA